MDNVNVAEKPWLAEDQLPDWHVKNIYKSTTPIEPASSFCTLHGPQTGPGCSDCWNEFGPAGRPPDPEEMSETDNLRAELASLRKQLNDMAAANEASAQEFAAYKEANPGTVVNPNAPTGDSFQQS